MIRSMTGYGEAERESAAGRLRLELKSVNHRFFNASVKTPAGFDKYEQHITEAVKRHLARGHVSVFLSVDRSSAPSGRLQIDLEKARAYHAALDSLRKELSVDGSVDLAMLARFGDIFRAPDQDRAEAVEPALIEQLAEDAARAARALREAEGRRRAEDLQARLAALAAELGRVELRAPLRLVEQRDRLREAVRELTEGVDVDEDRLAREIAYLAERWDVNEEIVRFRSHLELFREALAGDGTEPIGKRLAFLVQEMHREVNTIGSKGNDAEVSQASIRMKEEIERMREQVENVE
jgi:uncharacterized protein (TIGR00255 family)